MSSSLGASRNSETKKNSSFFLARLLPSRRRSKSRHSLESDSGRPETTLGSQVLTCSGQSSSPQPICGLDSPMVQVHQNYSNQDDNQMPYDNTSHSMGSVDGLAESASSESQGQACGDDAVEMLECPVCLRDKPKQCFPEIYSCHHRSCTKCLRQYFRIEIMESRVAIACPECSELFHPNDIRSIVEDDQLMQKYEDFMLRRVLAMDSDTRWCPAPDCGYAVIATGCAGCPKLKCERESCNTFFCYHCKQYWHPNQTCDAARAERSPNIRSASVSYSQESGGQNEIKSCPRCGAYIVKMDDGSCNHMTCAVCGAGFCWLCLKEISDLHYLSPSGCTFWGQKPWSRKKKILWQLGTLVGAPVGITLVAGIAVPAMIIGIPVWVGRKIHYRYELVSKHKRNLAITGGVAASILAAPVIATLAVGIGVPILLAYVYGVVPISLCRSGGCGVTTTNSGGVRFEFDEDNEANAPGSYNYAGDNHSLETTPNVANPSIGPSIGDASLGMTNSLSASGSHMDRVGVLRDDSDHDSSSHRAIAGTSINGSLCSATYSTQHHKLDVRADISEHEVLSERASVGGESYNLSLNASTHGLAGSIVSPKDKDGVSLCSRHFEESNAAAAAPIVYPEELSGKEDGGGQTSHHPQQQQQQGSSSCPTSPNLRKGSPAPSEDAKSTRGKKCTRFMDQVSEIETTTCDNVSMGSVLSEASNSPMEATTNSTSTAIPTFFPLPVSNIPVTTTSSVPPTSCQSLVGEDSEGPPTSKGSLRMKAESTSVLMEGVELRRCEMGGRQKDSRFGEDRCRSGRLYLGSRRNGGKANSEEHRSHPMNLSDVSEITGMPTLHMAGCSNLLTVGDKDSQSTGFLTKSSRLGYRLPSGSSSSSSSVDETADIPPHRRGFLGKQRFTMETCSDVGEDTFSQEQEPEPEFECSRIDMSETHLGNSCIPDGLQGNRPHKNVCRSKSLYAEGSSQLAQSEKFRWFLSKSASEPSTTDPAALSTNATDGGAGGGKLRLSSSKTSIGADSSVTSSPLPEVEKPNPAILLNKMNSIENDSTMHDNTKNSCQVSITLNYAPSENQTTESEHLEKSKGHHPFSVSCPSHLSSSACTKGPARSPPQLTTSLYRNNTGKAATFSMSKCNRPGSNSDCQPQPEPNSDKDDQQQMTVSISSLSVDLKQASASSLTNGDSQLQDMPRVSLNSSKRTCSSLEDTVAQCSKL